MKRTLIMLTLCLLILIGVSAVAAADGDVYDRYTLWFGSHYTNYTDYAKKVGEYLPSEEQFLPELRLEYLSRRPGSMFSIDGHYYDDNDINARVRSVSGDRFKLSVQYRSLTIQRGQDLLENMNAREALGYMDDPNNPGDSIQKPGGKIVTHTLNDAGVDYRIDRKEVTSRLETLLSRRNDLRLMVAHRVVIEQGYEQKVASMHCQSCHLESNKSRVDKLTQQLEAALNAKAGGLDVGYQMGYRSYDSKTNAPGVLYEDAVHPVFGTKEAEFGSRLVYDDTAIVYAVEPKTEKFSHRFRLKGDLGSGKFSGSLGYSKATNEISNLSSDAYSGAFKYAVALTPKMRLIAKLTAARLSADDPFIDLPTYRDGRAGVQTDFDYVRYSSLDRTQIESSAELMTRLNARTNLSVLAGYKRVDRDDYPTLDEGTATGKFTGQVKLRHRKGMKYSTMLRYRFEKTSDPFVSARGLFERRGREELQIPLPGFAFRFYFEREQLRYQDITTLPTDEHQFEFRTTYRPNLKTTMNIGLKASFDKNGDLDSLDVKHSSFQPHLALTMLPNPKWALTAGYTYGLDKSRGPVTVALFDG